MYQPVTDRTGQVIGYQYAGADGRQQFVPAVGVQDAQQRGGMLRMQGLMQRSRPIAAPAPQQNGFMFGGNVSAPPPPTGQPQMGSTQERSGGSPLYQKFYAKFSTMGDQLRGQLDGSAPPDTGIPTQADYRRGQRDQKLDMRAAQREADARAQATQAFANPYLMLDGWGQGMIGNATQDWYRAQPLTELTFLTQGVNGRDRFSTNADRFGGAVNRTAGLLGSGNMPTYGELMASLFNPSRNSAVGRSFQLPEAGKIAYDKNGIYQGQRRTTWDWAPAATQADQMRRYLAAVYQTGMRPSAQQPAMTYVNRLIDQWVAQNMQKNSAPPIFRWLGTQLGY